MKNGDPARTEIMNSRPFFELDIPEHKPFLHRIILGQRVSALLVLIIVIIGFKDSPSASFVLGAIIFVILSIKSYWTERNFITHIELQPDYLKIIYKNEHKELQIEGNIRDFSFKKRMAFNKSRPPYLVVYYKDKTIIKQHGIGDWKEDIFDKIITEYSTLLESLEHNWEAI